MVWSLKKWKTRIVWFCVKMGIANQWHQKNFWSVLFQGKENPEKKQVFKVLFFWIMFDVGIFHTNLYIPSTLNINLPYTVASTIDCGCSKMLNHGLNHGFFLSLFKLIPCPINWIVCVLAYLNFIFEF